MLWLVTQNQLLRLILQIIQTLLTRQKQSIRQTLFDWGYSVNYNTVDAYNTYLQDHPNGEHVDEAKDGIKQVNAKTVQPEEKTNDQQFVPPILPKCKHT